MNFYLLQWRPLSNSLLDSLIVELEENTRHKIQRFQFYADKWRAFFSDRFLKKILSEELNLPFDSIFLSKNGFGKPLLVGSKKKFNLSHSGEWIGVVTDEEEVGIDIEEVRPLENLSILVAHYFSHQEQGVFFSLEKEAQLFYFYELWTLKESYVKAVGQGMNLPFYSFSVFEKLIAHFIENKTWHFKSYPFISDYQGAICAQHDHFPQNPRFSSFVELLK
jgi:4'-phosphopantetheinyl transferase